MKQKNSPTPHRLHLPRLELIGTLRRFRLRQAPVEDIVRYLSAHAPAHKVPNRTLLLTQGSTPQEVFLVTAGCVKVFRVGRSGEEHVVGFKAAGDIFPECWAFGQATRTIYGYEALEKTKIITIDQELFHDMLASSPTLRDAFFAYFVKNYESLMMQVTALEQSHAVDKLLMILYYLMIQHGVERKKDEFWIGIRLRHTTLASLTGLSRETVTTELGKLRHTGVLDYNLKKFVIRGSALRQRIGDDALLV